MPPIRKRRVTKLQRTIQRLERQTWKNLHDSEQLGMSLSEESITDFLLLQLARQHRNEVAIYKYSKVEEGATTGADWEWWFGSRAAWIGIRVQAKKLDEMQYANLQHTVKGTRKKQVNLLVNDAKKRRLYPIYCFYNYWEDRAIKLGCPSPHLGDRRLQGCAVADAFLVQRKIKQGRIGLRDIAPIAMPLEGLLSIGASRSATALPNAVYASLSSLSGTRGRRAYEPKLVATPPGYVIELRDVLTSSETRPGPYLLSDIDDIVDGVMVVYESGE